MTETTSAKLTPMLEQFYEQKKHHGDAILFYRMGDFYEMFGEDAVTASKILQIQLTSRNKNQENALPMCGVPVHAWEGYVNKLSQAGLKVAICEQMENPALAKGLVKRQVVRVITPGTVLAEDLLEPGKNHYLLSLLLDPKKHTLGLALADLTTGELELDQIEVKGGGQAFLERFAFYRPREVLYPTSKGEDPYRAMLNRLTQPLPHLEPYSPHQFDLEGAKKQLTQHFGVLSLDGFGLAGLEQAIGAAGALFGYLKQTQQGGLSHFQAIRRVSSGRSMTLDEATQRNLELFESQGTGGDHSLIKLMDHCKTPMGSRMLRRWMGMPLTDRAGLEARLDGVECFFNQSVEAAQLRTLLGQVGDVERILARITLSEQSLGDLVRLQKALVPLEGIKGLLPRFQIKSLTAQFQNFDSLSDLRHYLNHVLADEPALKLQEGGFVASGFDERLDQLRGLAKNGKQLLANLEAKEKKESGISGLKVSYNRVFGYYIEISKAAKGQVPAHFHRKQTLVSSERYVTEELTELEESLLSAEDEAKALELEIFRQLRQKVLGQIKRLQDTAKTLAKLDLLANLAQLARERNYVRPQFNPDPKHRYLNLVGARHPVIENLGSDPFVANQLALDSKGKWILIITGPNMGGKSTYMRQAALIALMAQMGSFVPAEQVELPLFDRIFTRVGASDNLARGQSTFMVEMSEAASILNNATEKSLIILDEIGRGTSTYDGISLAWAIIEHLHQLGALTLFATHYRELTSLEENHPGVTNAKVVVGEEAGKMVFFHKVIAGKADQSYGIQVAQLAGLPKSVVTRSKVILAGLEEDRVHLADSLDKGPSPAMANQQISFAEPTWADEIRAFDLNHKSPIEAMFFLEQLQKRLS